jgi:hypothetical protein
MENYRYFIAFLGAHCLLLTYGSCAMALLLASEAVEKDLMKAQFWSASKKAAVPVRRRGGRRRGRRKRERET